MNLPKGNVKPSGNVEADPLNATQGSLLGFLHGGPKTGWDLIEEISACLRRFWNVTTSHVYRELRTLEARGLIRAGAPGPRDRRPFSITAAGRRAFAEWIAQPPGQEQMRFPLLVTLWFGRHVDAETMHGFVTAARAEHTSRLDFYGAILPHVADDPYVTAVVQFGVRYEEAILAWLDDLPAAVRSSP